MTASTPEHLSLGKRLVFSLVPVLLLLLAAEVVVRRTGAALTCPLPSYLNAFLWECDPVLHFRMSRTLIIDGQPLNSLGTRGPLLDPSARRRMIALGDSVTFGFINQPQLFISHPYPERLQALADKRAGPGALSVLNAGVCGYNSYHGIMLLRTKLRAISADLILVQYGWNDLLTTAAYTDSTAFREPASALGRFGEDLLLRTALYPFAVRVRMELDQYRLTRSGVDPKAKPHFEIPATWAPNVPVEEYEHNLRRIIELAHNRGAAVWLATSPDAFTTDDYRDREDAYEASASLQLGFLKFGGITSFRQFDEIHSRYNDAVRRVGADAGVPVVDVDAVFRAHSAEHLFTSVDAIHPTDAGHAIEAEALAAQIEASRVLGSVDPAR